MGSSQLTNYDRPLVLQMLCQLLYEIKHPTLLGKIESTHLIRQPQILWKPGRAGRGGHNQVHIGKRRTDQNADKQCECVVGWETEK